MVRHGEDAVFEGKVEPIPSTMIDISDFENRYDMTIFDGLTVSSVSSNYLLGVPLGYETLGVFYNTNLMRTGVPASWAQVNQLYADFPTQTYTTNL